MGLKLGNYSNSTVLGSVGLENLVLKERNASPKKCNNDLVELEVKTATWTFGALHATKSTKKVITLLTGAIDANYKWQIHLLLHIGNNGVYT